LEQKSYTSKDCQRVKQKDVGGAVEPGARNPVCTSRRESDTGCAEDTGNYEK